MVLELLSAALQASQDGRRQSLRKAGRRRPQPCLRWPGAAFRNWRSDRNEKQGDQDRKAGLAVAPIRVLRFGLSGLRTRHLISTLPTSSVASFLPIRGDALQTTGN